MKLRLFTLNVGNSCFKRLKVYLQLQYWSSFKFATADYRLVQTRWFCQCSESVSAGPFSVDATRESWENS